MAYLGKRGALLTGAAIVAGSIAFAALKPERPERETGRLRPYDFRSMPGATASAPLPSSDAQSSAVTGSEPAQAPPTASANEETSAPAGATLPDGEYACYGSGSTVLAGLGFKTSGGRYTDLDGGNAGAISVQGTDVVFSGGHLDGQRGRELTGKSFRIGSMAVCEKW